MSKITPSERAALAAFARQHGRRWKATLHAQWMAATASPDLMALRNTRGPSWLIGVSL